MVLLLFVNLPWRHLKALLTIYMPLELIRINVVLLFSSQNLLEYDVTIYVLSLNLRFTPFQRIEWFPWCMDDLHISHNASGMEANIRILVT